MDDEAAWWSAIRSGNHHRVLSLLSKRGGSAPIANDISNHSDPNDLPTIHPLPGKFPRVLRGRKHDLKIIDHRFGFGQDRQSAAKSTSIHRTKKIPTSSEYFWLPNGVNAAKLRTEETAAHVACAHGFSEILLILIEEGCDLLKTTNSLSTPLHFAAKNGHTETIEIILDSLGSQFGSDAAQDAILLRNGAGETSIAAATRNGHSEALLLLCQSCDESSVNMRNDMGETCIELAARCGFEQCVQILLQYGASPHGNLTRRTKNGYIVANPDPLLWAVRGSSPGIVKALRLAGAKVKHSHLYESARAHARDIILPTLTNPSFNTVQLNYDNNNNNNDNNDKDEEQSVLSIQSKKEEAISMKKAIETAMLSNRPDIAFALLKQVMQTNDNSLTRTVANSKLENQSTLLHLASRCGHSSSIEILLKMEANVNAINETTGNTPLHECSNDICAELLLNAGADVTVVNGIQHVKGKKRKDSNSEDGGATPLHYACRRGDPNTVRLLLQNHAKVNVRDVLGISPLVEAIRCAPILQTNANEIKNKNKLNNETISQLQIYNQHIQVVHLLSPLDAFARGPIDLLLKQVGERDLKILALEKDAKDAKKITDRHASEALERENELKKSSACILEILTQIMLHKTFKNEVTTACVESYQKKMNVKKKEMEMKRKKEKEEMEKQPGFLQKKMRMQSGKDQEDEDEEKEMAWPGVAELSLENVFVEAMVVNKNPKKKAKQKSKKVFQKEYQERCKIAMEKAGERLRKLLIEGDV